MEAEAIIEKEKVVGTATATDGGADALTPAQASGNNPKPVFKHIELMEKNKLTLESLPKEVRMKINAWSMGVRKHDKTPSGNLLEMNKKGSIAIADAIQDWIEKDLPEKSEEEVRAEVAKAEAADKIVQEESERKERERIRNATPPQKTKEQKVAEILKEKGKIHYRELVEILGQEFSSEIVKVGSIKLLNTYFTNNYKQVN